MLKKSFDEGVAAAFSKFAVSEDWIYRMTQGAREGKVDPARLRTFTSKMKRLQHLANMDDNAILAEGRGQPDASKKRRAAREVDRRPRSTKALAARDYAQPAGFIGAPGGIMGPRRNTWQGMWPDRNQTLAHDFGKSPHVDVSLGAPTLGGSSAPVIDTAADAAHAVAATPAATKVPSQLSKFMKSPKGLALGGLGAAGLGYGLHHLLSDD